MSSARATDVTADPTIPAIRITREFDAPPAAVFRAHVDPELVVRWLGPRAMTMSLVHWDARTGGSFHYTHTGDDGDAHGFYGSFHELRENERIVQTFCYLPYPDSVSLETLTLVELPGGRTRLESLSLTDSFEVRDAMISGGMEVGVDEGYERLDEMLR